MATKQSKEMDSVEVVNLMLRNGWDNAYEVQHAYDGDWITGLREDLYDGENDDVLEQPAVFQTRDEAERYLSAMVDLIACGAGDPQMFRILHHDQEGTTYPAS